MINIDQTLLNIEADQFNRIQQVLDQLLSRSDVGFFKTPERDHIWSRSKKRAQELRAGFKTLGIVGIGGSSIGAKAIYQSLVHQIDRQVLFFDNIDVSYFYHQLQAIENLNEVHWLVISKSGNTIETLNMTNYLVEYLIEHSIDLTDKFTVISEAKMSLLTEWATKESIPQLELPEDIGGRFSVLTPVGLLPAEFMGLSVDDFKTGALWALQQKKIIIELTGQSLESFKRKERLTLFWFYSEYLSYLGPWVQQLWAESLAKATDKSGQKAPQVSTPLSLRGVSDQHSILQQITEGARDKFIWFIRCNEAEQSHHKLQSSLFNDEGLMLDKSLGDLMKAEVTATFQSLSEKEVHNLVLSVNKVDAQSLGAFFMLFQLVVGLIGECLNINAYNQPGVEAGKRLARQFLQSVSLSK